MYHTRLKAGGGSPDFCEATKTAVWSAIEAAGEDAERTENDRGRGDPGFAAEFRVCDVELYWDVGEV